MKHGNKNRSNTRKILNNSNVHTHERRHARAYPPPPPHTHTHSITPPPPTHTHTQYLSLSLSLSHTHTHTHKQNNNRPFHKSTNWTQKSIQIGKTDTADYGDSKLIKLFSFNYKGMILLLPSQRTIEGRQVLSSVDRGHGSQAQRGHSSIGSGASKRCCKHILCCCSSGTSGTVQFQMMFFLNLGITWVHWMS